MKKLLLLLSIVFFCNLAFCVQIISPVRCAVLPNSNITLKWVGESCSSYKIELYEKAAVGFKFIAQGYPKNYQTSAIIRAGALKTGVMTVWVIKAIKCVNGQCTATKNKWRIFYVGNKGATTTPVATNTTNTNTNTTTTTNTSKALSYNEIIQKSDSQIRGEVVSKHGITFSGVDKNWTKNEIGACYNLFENIDGFFVKHTKGVKRQSMYRSPGVLGYVRMPTPVVYLLDSTCRSRSQLQNTLSHEMAHTFQCTERTLSDQWSRQFHGISSSWDRRRVSGAPTSYGNTNTLEDMAESVRLYIFNPTNLKGGWSTRYNFIKANMMKGSEYTGREML